ncbi:MAG: DNA polymerase III subunit delta [Alphaproteobacteria bacterium]|nr:DNA polymerase III subunit delta [Alphaproteobacteria bacterium]
MKIAPKLVDNFLQKPDSVHKAALLYGPDSGGVRDRAKKMTAAILGANFDPFALVELPESSLLADHALLSDELSAVSMMAPRRVILIRDGGDKLTKIIDGAASCFNADTFLIVMADELTPRSSLRAWFEKSDVAAALACYRDEVRDIQGLIRKAFDEAKLPLDREVGDYLASQLGNDRYVTYQELEKIITYAGGKPVTLADVQALVDYNRETNLDDIVSAVADKNVIALEKMLMLFAREGMQPVAYLRALQRYFNRLYSLKAQVLAGYSADQVVAAIRPPVFFRQVPVLTRHIQNWSIDSITRALALLVSAELACKSSDTPALATSSRYLLQIAQIR